MTTQTQVTFTSNESSDDSEGTTEIEQTIDNILSRIHRPAATQRKIGGEEKKTYDRLMAKIKRDQKIIAQLELENKSLKEEIARCETKIRSYPRMKSKYDQLSDSLAKSTEAYSISRVTSPRKMPFT